MAYLVAFPAGVKCSSASVPKHDKHSIPKVGRGKPSSASHGHAARGGISSKSRARSRSVSLAAPDSSGSITRLTLEDFGLVTPKLPELQAGESPGVGEPPRESPSLPAASAPPEPATSPIGKTTFQKRVEAAAAALKTGTASQTRRRAPTSVPAATGSPAAPAPVQRANAPTGRASSKNTLSQRPAPSLIERAESESEMAASQRRLFEQMVTLRTRLNERLAASNKFAKFLEFTLQQRDTDIKHANERLVAAMLEIESLKSIVQDAAEAAVERDPEPGSEGDRKYEVEGARGGVSREERVAARLETVTRRLDLMSKALKKDVEKIDAACIKSVPIRWVGMASDIRIMGSFDHWTKGVAMSPEHIEGGSNVFVAEMNLVPGHYQIKFVVDGIWQTAAEWPTEGFGLDANNILVVE